MIKTFANFKVLNYTLADDVIDAVSALEGVSARVGISNVSESGYAEFTNDEGGEIVIKLRFSGHADYHGSDYTFRTDKVARAIWTWSEAGDAIEFDDDGEAVDFEYFDRSGTEDDKPADAEYSHVEIDAEDYEEIVRQAVEMVKASAKVAA
jgi:hypothetical protein